MIKYILHGGKTGIPNEHNKAFYQSWVKDFEPDFIPTILLVYFALPIEEWSKLELQDKERFINYTNNRKAKFIIAKNDTNIFRNQLITADVVYVRGGSSEDVIKLFTPIKDELTILLDGKIYAGSSAGVKVMCHNTCSDYNYWKKVLGYYP